METIMTLLGTYVLLLLLNLQETVDASPQWGPRSTNPLRPMRRRNGGSPTAGCWTPRGIMELGQRIYPSGCSRIVCKKMAGEPIIEHQFCKTSTSEVPENCIRSQREWLRYPDCCPELHCSPAPTVMDEAEKSFLINGHSSQANDAEGSTSIVRGKFDQSRVTPPPKLYMTTEIVYGVGISKPFQPTTQKLDDENESRFQHSDFLDSSLTRYYDSPGNTLNGWEDGKWQEELVTEIPYQYKEDFSDSIPTDPGKITPYVITYPTTSDLTYPLTANKTSTLLYHFFNNAEQVLTSPLPYRQNVYESTPITPRPVTYQNPHAVRPAPLPHKRYQSADVRTASYLLKDAEVTTQKPYIKPTTYSPPSDLRAKFKTTPSNSRQPTQNTFPNVAVKATTPSIEWAAKTTKNSFKPTTKHIKDPSPLHTKFSPSPPKYDTYTTMIVENTNTTKRPVLYKTSQRSPQIVTNRERIPSQVKKQPIQGIPSISTITQQKTTPVSYEFATPKLNPNNHDLIEFIHSTLDPSALIPGHDGYIKSKYDSKKDYISKAENPNNQHRKMKRSLSYEVSTSPYNMDSEALIDPTERRGRPMFYIPWRDEAENDIVTELTTSIDITSTKSQPLSKIEQAPYILQAYEGKSRPSFNAMKPQINETTYSDAKIELDTVEELESANFSEFRNMSGSNLQSVTLDGVKRKETPTNETIIEQRGEKQEEIVSEKMNENTSETSNFSAVTTKSSLQINLNETITKTPAITHATVSSTTTLPENDFNSNDTYESSTEISFTESYTVEEQGDPSVAESMKTQRVTTEISIEAEDNIKHQEEKLPAITDSSVNTTLSNRDRKLPNSRRKSQRRRRPQQITPSKIIGKGESQENQAELTLQEAEPQFEEEVMSRSAPQQRQSWNQRQSSETGRTRVYVPVLHYERKNERNHSDILQLEPNVSTVTFPSSNDNFPTELENFYPGKGGYRASSLPGLVTGTHSRRENSMSQDDSQLREKVPHIFENASDHLRKQSSSQLIMQEMRSKYHPGTQTNTQTRNNPSLYGRSELYSAMESTHAVEHMKDSYEEKEIYSRNSGNFQGNPKTFFHPQTYNTNPNKAESNSKIPVFASAERQASRSYIREAASNHSTSMNNRKPPFNKWFTDIFGDNQPPKERALNPSIRPHVPRDESEDVRASRPESKFTVSQNYDQNIRTHYPSEDIRYIRNNSSGITNSQKSFTVPQRPPSLLNNGYRRESSPEPTETPWASLEKHFATSSPLNTAILSYFGNGSAQNTFLGKPSSVLLPETKTGNIAKIPSMVKPQAIDRNSTNTSETKLQNTYIEVASNFGNDSVILREVPKIYQARNLERYRPSTNKPIAKISLAEVPHVTDFQIIGNEDNSSATQLIKRPLLPGRSNRRRTPGTIEKNGVRNRTPTTSSSFDNVRTSSLPPKYPGGNRHMKDFETASITADNSQRQQGFPQNRFSFHHQDTLTTISPRPAKVRGRSRVTSSSSGNNIPSYTGNPSVNQPTQSSLKPNVRTNTRQRSFSHTKDAINNPSVSESARESVSFSPWETIKPAYKPAPRFNINPDINSTPSVPVVPVPENPALIHLDIWEPQRKNS